MEFLNLFLRFGTIVLLAFLVVLNIRDVRNLTPRIIMSGLAISTGAYIISFSSDVLHVSDALHRAALYIHSPNIAFAWLFGLVLFDDEFKFRWEHAVFSGLYIIPAIIICAANPDIDLKPTESGKIIVSFYGLILMGHLIYKLVAGYQDDLIDARRRARLFFITALIIVSIVMSFAEINMMPLPSETLEWLKITTMFVMTLWVLFWVTRLDINQLSFSRETAMPRDAAPALAGAQQLDPRDDALKQRLIQLMKTEQAYIEPGLTIRSLAETLGAPEHRLRHVINKGLGYRNFSAFLNSYRITAIKAALKDPKKTRLPILTLAMDYGYNSLAPFNRAFRESEGMTPSEYRHKLHPES